MQPGNVDRALLAVLVPLWALCFALGVRTVLADTAGPGAFVAPRVAKDAYPVVTGIAPPVRSQTALRPGDRLLSIGDVDLRGKGPVQLRAILGREAAGGRRPDAAFERSGVIERTPFPVFPYSRSGAPQKVASAVLLLSAVVLLLRAAGSRVTRAFGHAFLGGAITFTSNFVGSASEVWLSLSVGALANSVTFPLALRAALQFPQPPRHESRWGRWAPWLFAIHGPLATTRNYGIPTFGDAVVAGGAAFGVEIFFFGTLLGVLTRAYRRADPIGRRRLRWIVVAAWWALAPPVLLGVISLAVTAHVDLAWLFFASTSALALLPVGILFAIARYNLFDVDRLLSATAAWNALLVLLALAIFALLPPVADRLAAASGLDAATSRVALGVALVVAALPVQRRLRSQIERVFFSERYAADRGVEVLLHELAGSSGPQDLTRRCGEGITALFRPESCAIYARGEADFVPIFSVGSVPPAGFEADGPLAAALRRRREPLVLNDAGRRPEDAPLGPFDRAALESLAAEVVLPVRRGEELRALVCLGPKRSGDLYTPTDVTLLSVLTDKVGTELLRFEDAQLIAEGREMAEALRRYVPGAIADELDRGRALDEGEREVSVLFVDIRGYTAFAEERRSQEVFSSVSRYTEAVSRCVRAHGGAVVEFNGDGMMAVFGAPTELEDKERCAVRAGLAMLEEVAGLEGGGDPIEVGVGVATGPAFVGNIRAVDRWIWSAIGTTTNTAARIQQLTRELGVALLVDEATWSRLGPVGKPFARHPDVAIRGRREAQTLYALGAARLD